MNSSLVCATCTWYFNAMTIKRPRRKRSQVQQLGTLSQPAGYLEMFQRMVMILERLPFMLLPLSALQTLQHQPVMLITTERTLLITPRDSHSDRHWVENNMVQHPLEETFILFGFPKYIPTWLHFQCHTAPPCQWRLRRAAKARITRMLQPKSKRKELTPPDYVRKEWEQGDKNGLADLLQRCNFDRDLGLMVLGYVGLIYVDVWGSIVLSILPTCDGTHNVQNLNI